MPQHPGMPGLENVSWDDIGLIAAIADFPSLRQAAKALGLNVSTLVRHIERLEAGLRTSIVDRLPQGFQLNGNGQAIAVIAKDMQRHFVRLQDVASRDLHAQGQVRIAVTEGLGTFWIAPKLPQFAEDNPDILINMDCSMDLRNLLRNEADIAIQFRKPDNPDLVVAKLCTLHIYPFASLRYLEKHGLPSLGDRPSGHRIVLQESEQIANDAIVAFMGKHRIDRNISFITNSSMAHFYAVESGLGIGGLPNFAMAMGAQLIPIDLDFHHSAEVWISYRKEMRRIKRMSIVIDWLKQIFNPHRYPWFASTFMHPADVLKVVVNTMNRSDMFDFRTIKGFVDVRNSSSISEFRRNVGRPKIISNSKI
jgi:DNA-binding transcriptional LysR family regulator